MFDVRIFINNTQVDAELQGLPLVFTRELDKWGDFVGSDGTRAKPLNDALYLPATKQNSAVLAQFGDVEATSTAAQGKLPIYVEVNGTRVFTGWVQRTIAQRSAAQLGKYALRVLGDSVDIMQQLDGVSLRELNLGTMPTAPEDITATWVGVADTDSHATVWQPVIYGGIYIETFLIADTFTYRAGLRPAVRIWRILEAIFEERFGYAIQSSLYRTEGFRNLLYLYGVGDDWERTDDVAPFRCFVGANTQSSARSPYSITFARETAPFFDAQNLNSRFGYFQPPSAGWYRMEFFVSGSNISAVKIIGDYAQPSSPIFTQREIASGQQGENIIIEELYFEPTYGLTRVRVTVEGVRTITISNTTTYNAQLLPRFAYGAPLRIASCLHDKPVKEFLRGLQHMFGLVFAVDNLNRTVRIDPRFVNAIQSNVVPSLNNLVGYYDTQAADSEELRADVTEVSLENRRPFGDYLTLQYADDSGDAALGEILKQLGDTFPAPIYGQRTEFIEAAKKGTELPNGFFTPVCNALITPFPAPTTSELQRFAQWMCVADSEDEFRIYSSEMYYNAQYLPTRRSEPKAAVYYGLLDFSAPQYFLKYELGFNASRTVSSQILTTFPCAFMVFPDDAGYHEVFADVPFQIPYSTPEYTNPSRVTTYALGLIDRFHRKYLSCIYKDKWYALRSAVNTQDYLRDYFTLPKALRLQGSVRKCWQTSTQGYAPIESSTADVVLIEDADSDDLYAYPYTANTLTPVLIIGGYVKATTVI